jgi:transposase
MSRRRTPQQKLEIIHEARTGGLSVSHVCRKHGIPTSIFYLWEKRFKDAGLDGLKPDQTKKAMEKVEELEAEVTRLKDLIAEIAEENFRLKKGQWP